MLHSPPLLRFFAPTSIESICHTPALHTCKRQGSSARSLNRQRDNPVRPRGPRKHGRTKNLRQIQLRHCLGTTDPGTHARTFPTCARPHTWDEFNRTGRGSSRSPRRKTNYDRRNSEETSSREFPRPVFWQSASAPRARDPESQTKTVVAEREKEARSRRCANTIRTTTRSSRSTVARSTRADGEGRRRRRSPRRRLDRIRIPSSRESRRPCRERTGGRRRC